MLPTQRFHAGLFEAAVVGGAPCLPVTLSYATPPGTAAPAWTVAWWGPVPIVRHTLRMMREGPVRATVRFPAEPLVGSDRKQLAERLQAEVAGRFEPLRQEPVPPPLPGDPAPDEGNTFSPGICKQARNCGTQTLRAAGHYRDFAVNSVHCLTSYPAAAMILRSSL